MLSFIVIARNEGWKLTKCLESVYETISYNKLDCCEVIYIDSNSSDDSIDRAKKYDKIKIFKITGHYNAAIARNIGASESKNDTLFFIDGDMEIHKEFLPLVYSDEGGLKYSYVSGQLVNYYYNTNGKFLYKELYYKKLENEKNEVITGGLFLIKRNHWIEVGGMKNKYRRSQDLDLGLRLAKKGIQLCLKNEIAANHHTVSYKDKSRSWETIFKGDQYYGRSVLYRDHLFNGNKYILRLIIRRDYTLILLILSLMNYLIFNEITFFIPYFILLIIRSVNSYKSGLELSKNITLYFFLRDILTFIALFIFFPKSKMVQYKPII